MAERQRRDEYGECNADRHPIEVFTRECCANCFNPVCTRSLAGKLKFDERTSTWYERFYGDKDKMSPGDPRFQAIAAQKFMVINPGRTPEVGSSWVDPRDLQETGPVPVPSPVQVQRAPAPEPTPLAEEAWSTDESPQASGPLRKIPHQLLLANTPVQHGQMIAPPPSMAQPLAQSAAPKDPWTGPVPTPKSDVPVVSPGGRVKMGGDGV